MTEAAAQRGLSFLSHYWKKKNIPSDHSYYRTADLIEALPAAEKAGGGGDSGGETETMEFKFIGRSDNRIKINAEMVDLDEVAGKIECAERRGDSGTVFKLTKMLKGSSVKPLLSIRAANGNILSDKSDIASRW